MSRSTASVLKKLTGLSGAKVTTKPAKVGGVPKAVITVTEKDGMLNIKCVFTPCAKADGPAHPAHGAALEMLTLFGDNKKAGE